MMLAKATLMGGGGPGFHRYKLDRPVKYEGSAGSEADVAVVVCAVLGSGPYTIVTPDLGNAEDSFDNCWLRVPLELSDREALRRVSLELVPNEPVVGVGESAVVGQFEPAIDSVDSHIRLYE